MKVVQSKVREAVSKDLRVSSNFFKGLDMKVMELIKMAEKRCMANGRKTLRDTDI